MFFFPKQPQPQSIYVDSVISNANGWMTCWNEYILKSNASKRLNGFNIIEVKYLRRKSTLFSLLTIHVDRKLVHLFAEKTRKTTNINALFQISVHLWKYKAIIQPRSMIHSVKIKCSLINDSIASFVVAYHLYVSCSKVATSLKVSRFNLFCRNEE